MKEDSWVFYDWLTGRKFYSGVGLNPDILNSFSQLNVLFLDLVK